MQWVNQIYSYPKDKLLILIIFLLLGGLFGIVAYELSRPKQKQKPTLVETIKYLHDTVYRYQPAKYQPAITKIRTEYRERLVKVPQWVFDSSWRNLCDSFANGEEMESCQRLVVRRLLSGERDSALLRIYQSQRTEDSLQIGMMFKLDSMTSELIKQKDGEITQAKRESRRKGARNAFIGGLLGFIVGVVL